MELASFIISILALVFGLLGFLAGGWAVVDLLASKRSTHRITQLPIVQEETQVVSDLPPHILDQLPTPPEKMTAEQYMQWEARQADEDEFLSEVA